MHTPVLPQEVLKIFNPQPGESYIDATINGGGHAKAIAERIGETGKLLGIDWDCELLERIRNQKSGIKNIELVCGNNQDIERIAKEKGFSKVNGILFDLGFSSYHIEKSGRGFSFQRDEPLDMRYSPGKNELTAEKIVNTWTEGAIEDILRRFGEERYSRRIAGAIARYRQRKRISRSRELALLVSRALPDRGSRLHPATKTFQALRIAVNNELENLSRALQGSMKLLAKGGKIAVISFQSLDDRIIKNFLKNGSGAGLLKIITSKPVIPSREEVTLNPRAGSAKLRAAIKL